MSKNKTDLTFQEETQTLIGQRKRKLEDLDTGEIIEVDQIVKRAYGQKAFWKLYLMDFMNVLGILENKQVDVLIYIAENTEPTTNLFVGTYKKIAKNVKCSEPTIAKVMKKLREKNFIKLVQSGVYMLNPTILMKGSVHKQQILLSYYNTADEPVRKNESGQRPVSKLATSTGIVPSAPEEEGQVLFREKFEDVEDETD